ncbi:Abi family protein, partial [Gilvimarinus sp. SDUM040013]|uniref:Abi family protein n=1 Tax=Gilvimarinus gilvus TaxID=3058038 RepID=UPI002673727A
MIPPFKIPFAKQPRSFADQVQILQSHGLNIPDQTKAEFYLSQLNYYRLAAYCLPFEQNHATHQVIPGTSFDDVLNLYIFDRELRLLLMDAIERVEVSLRTQMAYHLSHRHN